MPLAAVTASFVDLVERLRTADAEGEAEADVGSRRWAACSAMGGCILENHSSIIRWMLCGLLGGKRGGCCRC